MLMHLIVGSLLAHATPVAGPEWAIIGINGDGDTVYLVDRASIAAGTETTSGILFAVSQKTAMRLHVDFNCTAGQYRFLESSNPNGDLSGATRWSALKEGTPMHQASQYICSGGKIDLGLGDSTYNAERPEPFARRFLELRSKKN